MKYILFSLYLLIAPLIHNQASAKQAISEKKVVVNILIHGVCNIEQNFHFSSLYNIVRDSNIYNSYYHHNVSTFRKKPYMYQFQAMQGIGLLPITDESHRPGNSSGALVFLLEETWKTIDRNHTKELYYTFGWSGLHSIKEYTKAGEDCYNALEALQKMLSKQGLKPYIRIWGYSYGGAVGLMMAHQHHRQSFIVDELILIGTPFLRGKIIHLIESSLFSKVYNFYSRGDKVQTYDLISPEAFWCERKLTKRSINPLPKNLVQVEIKYTVPSNQALRNKKSFMYSSDLTKQAVITSKSRLLHSIYPGHIEMWCFGWSPAHYRKDFITNPIPAATFAIPYALHMISHVTDNYNPIDHYIIDVRPGHEKVLLNKKGKKKTVNLASSTFLSNAKYISLKEIIKANCMPCNVTAAHYSEQTTQINKESLERWITQDTSLLIT